MGDDEGRGDEEGDCQPENVLVEAMRKRRSSEALVAAHDEGQRHSSNGVVICPKRPA